MRLSRLREFVRDQLVLVAISFAAFASGPAILHAQTRTYSPTAFSASLDLARGRLLPGASDARVLPQDDICFLVVEEWGWDSCVGVDAIVVGHLPGIDNTIIETPNSQGLVKLDDWQGDDRDVEIGRIEAGLRQSLVTQSERTGDDIRFIGWRSYPTLNEEKGYLYYAVDLTWNGAPQTNVKATVFDRRGYVVFMISPVSADSSADRIEELIDLTLNRYVPDHNESYAAFVSGDKVATAGALGVLAGMVGVKYGKSATAGVVATLLLVAKKAWFVLLLPLIWLRRLFR